MKKKLLMFKGSKGTLIDEQGRHLVDEHGRRLSIGSNGGSRMTLLLFSGSDSVGDKIIAGKFS